MSTSAPVTFLDRAELAWAAGFFDGEGSTIARTLTSRPGYHQLNVTVPQSGRDGIPAVLLRFQRVMLGMGHISGPSDVGIYMLRYAARGSSPRARAHVATPRRRQEGSGCPRHGVGRVPVHERSSSPSPCAVSPARDTDDSRPRRR